MHRRTLASLLAGAATRRGLSPRPRRHRPRPGRCATSRSATPTAPPRASCRPTRPARCVPRSTSNYPHVIAARTGAQLTDVTCGAAETKDFFAAQYPGVAPQLDALRPAHAAGDDDHRRQRQQHLHRRHRRVRRRPGCRRSARAARARTSTAPRSPPTSAQKTYPALKRSLRAVMTQGAARAGRDPRLPVDPAPDRGLLRQDAGRRRATCPTSAASRPPSTTPYDARPPPPARRTSASRKASEGHDACQPTGVRWIEPVLQGTNPVVVHPNALGESRMATRTMKVLHRH